MVPDYSDVHWIYIEEYEKNYAALKSSAVHVYAGVYIVAGIQLQSLIHIFDNGDIFHYLQFLNYFHLKINHPLLSVFNSEIMYFPSLHHQMWFDLQWNPVVKIRMSYA